MTTGKDIGFAASLLRAGDVVGIPTETVYGLAANAWDPDAVLKVFVIKNRPAFNPLIVHIGNWEMLGEAARDVPPLLMDLAKAFWPGPLTILVPRSEKIHDLVTAGSDLVALRMPRHPLTLTLIETCGFPLAAPSANPFGYISPTTAIHVARQLGSGIPYVLDGGPCTVGVESTIVRCNDHGEIEILRSGGITAEQIAAITGKLPVTASHETGPVAPGMLKSHYAPRKPLFLGNPAELLLRYKNYKVGVLSFRREFAGNNINCCKVLSPSGDTVQAARNLFAFLRELDDTDAEILIAEPLPEQGLGIAVNERLFKASAGNLQI